MAGVPVKSGLYTSGLDPPSKAQSFSHFDGHPDPHNCPLGRGGVAMRLDNSRHRGIQPICELAISQKQGARARGGWGCATGAGAASRRLRPGCVHGARAAEHPRKLCAC
eukprot:353100-Chlamydomonas_euryale.AAC.2